MAKFLFGLGMIVVMTFAAACGRENSEPAEPQDQIAESVRLTVAAVTQSGTTIASGGNEIPPTRAGQPDAATTCSALTEINLRGGPGTIYEPPIGIIGAGITFRPIAYVPSGFPQGAWIQVEIAATGQTAWVTAGPQFVSCTVDPAGLPRPAFIPATPRPADQTPAPTPQPVAALPPNLRNISGGTTTCPDHPDIASEFPTVDPAFLLRVDAQLTYPPAGESGNGAGIDRVEFVVDGVDFSHTERVAGYCIFEGGEPDCHDWPRDAFGRLTWGAGGPLVVDGDYRITATVYPRPETGAAECHWNVLLTIDIP